MCNDADVAQKITKYFQTEQMLADEASSMQNATVLDLTVISFPYF